MEVGRLLTLQRRMVDRKNRGVTLVELLVAVVIIAILALIAVPSYQYGVIRGHRAEVRVLLTQFAAELSEVSMRSATGQLPGDLSASIAVWDKRNEFYHIDAAVLDQGFGYWIVAYPNKEMMQRGDGAQAVSHTGAGCWYKHVDKPSVNAPCDSSKYELW